MYAHKTPPYARNKKPYKKRHRKQGQLPTRQRAAKKDQPNRPYDREWEISNRVSIRENGLREVATPCGYIDVLTHQEVIEVKHYSKWKGAIGQALCYAQVYPGRTPRIHLYGKLTHDYRAMVLEFCRPLNLRATFEQDFAPLDKKADRQAYDEADSIDLMLLLPM